jgi:hypothetical protein
LGLCKRDDSDDEAEDVLEVLEEDPPRARPGDHLMTPFQCDLCHFRNIQGGNPSEELVGHGALLAAIRRANLDAFWARRPNTVGFNLYEMRRMVKTAVKM